MIQVGNVQLTICISRPRQLMFLRGVRIRPIVEAIVEPIVEPIVGFQGTLAG